MSDAQLVTTIIGLVVAAGGGIAAGIRWAARLWAQIRREEIDAARTNAAQVSADHARMVEALVAQARAHGELIGEFRVVATKLDLVAACITGPTDETPSERRRRLKTVPQGHRSPRTGEHNND